MLGRTILVLVVLGCAAGCAAGDERASDTSILGALNTGDAGSASAAMASSGGSSGSADSPPATMLLPPEDRSGSPATAGMVVLDAATDMNEGAASSETSTTGDGGKDAAADGGMCANRGCFTVVDCAVYNTLYPGCAFTACTAYVCK
jgi:hypothetical protein